MTKIRLTDIDKKKDSRYQRTYILKRIRLDVAEGDFLTTMGPSGAGKSTLLDNLGLRG